VSAARTGLLVATLALAACTSLPVVDVPSENHGSRIRHLVLHFTSERCAESLRLLTQRTDRPVSAHWLIPDPRDPSCAARPMRLYRLVPEDRRAWHAGRSHWAGVTALNDSSIGIEIVNRSFCVRLEPLVGEAGPEDELCRWQDFHPAQIDAVIDLARAILERHPDIDPVDVVAHADITPQRRVDPGPRFPWERLARAGIGVWWDPERVAAHEARLAGTPLDVAEWQAALRAWGYDVEVTGTEDARTRFATRAFQFRFLPGAAPAAAPGRADARTRAVLLALLEAHRPGALQALRTAERDSTRSTSSHSRRASKGLRSSRAGRRPPSPNSA
jgi:N-acetyl-anhydromuramyl-L-alanine amidase AmpD